MSAFGPKRTSLVAPHMSAIGCKAEMAFCGITLSRSGLKRTWLVAAHMSAFDPKRTSDHGHYPISTFAMTGTPERGFADFCHGRLEQYSRAPPRPRLSCIPARHRKCVATTRRCRAQAVDNLRGPAHTDRHREQPPQVPVLENFTQRFLVDNAAAR
jgi:hypothetical protein